MTFLDRMTDVKRSAVKKSGEMMDAAKIKLKISENKSIVKEHKIEIGTVIYEKFCKGEELDPGLCEICGRIKQKEEENRVLEDELQ